VVVIQCLGVDFVAEGRGPQRCGPPGGVDLGDVDLVAYSACLDCFFRAAACIPFYSPM
jgi:hypothetical protein